MRVQEPFTELCSECIEGKIISKEANLIVFYPIVDFNVLEGHKYIANFVLVWYFTFMEIRIEVLDELGENCGRDATGC